MRLYILLALIFHCIFACGTGCKVCDSDRVICMQCQFQMLHDSICFVNQQPIQHCMMYATQYTCIACQQGYHLSQYNKCTATSRNSNKMHRSIRRLQQSILNSSYTNSIPNCVSYSPDTLLCQECRSGYQLTGDFFCVDINCQISGEGICTQCLNGYYAVHQSCISIPINNCLEYDGLKCTTCNNGYVYQSNLCIVADFTCNTLDSTSGLCSVCNTGYKMNQDSYCVDVNCNVSQLNVCNTCSAGFFLIGYLCAPIPIANCTQYSNNACAQCQTQFYAADNQTCLPAYPFCTVYNNTNGSCLACPTNKSLGFEMYCVDINCNQTSGGVCYQCNYPYYLSDQYTCTLIPVSNCKVYSNNLCYVCAAGYWLQLGLCVNSVTIVQDPTGNVTNSTSSSTSNNKSDFYLVVIFWIILLANI